MTRTVLDNAHLPIVGFAALSGTGKTTALRRLLPLLGERGLRVGVVKHAHHRFDVDHPGKDSYEIRKAGATQVMVVSRERWALMVEQPRQREPRLDEALLELNQNALDLVIVEGFKGERFPKIEIHRPSLGRPPLALEDDSIIAVASDQTLSPEVLGHRVQLDLNDPASICEFILEHIIGRELPNKVLRL